MSALVILKKSREGYKLNVRKLHNEVSELYADRDNNLPALDTLHLKERTLLKYEKTIEELNAQIVEKTPEEDIEEESRQAGEFMEIMTESMSQIDMMLMRLSQTDSQMQGQQSPNTQNTQAANDTHSMSGDQHNVRLPKLSLPRFSGNPLEFQEWWDMFESTIHLANLQPVEKMKYLKMALTGEAQALVSGYRVLAANYETVIDKLKERFGNKDVAINAHLEKLLALPAATSETKSLQAIYDEGDKHIRSLVALGMKEDTFGLVFAPILLSKLPWRIRKDLNSQNDNQSWSLEKLRKLLRNEISARFMADWSIEKPTYAAQERKLENTVARRPFGRARGSTGQYSTGGALANTSDSNAQPPLNLRCQFCQGGHFSDECTKVKTAQDRRAVAREKRLCFKCLRPGHTRPECKRQKPCYHCRVNLGNDQVSTHHSSLCYKRAQCSSNLLSGQNDADYYEPDSESEGEADSDPEANYTSAMVSGSGNAIRPYVYMQLAQVVLSTRKGEKVSARILFDSGSTCSYVTKYLQRKLELPVEGYQSFSNARFEDLERRTRTYPKVSLLLPCRNEGETVPLTLFVTNTISCPLQKLPLDSRKFPFLKSMKLADPLVERPELHEIDILIGSDHYFDIVGTEQVRLSNGLVLLESKLGYIPAGRVSSSSSSAEIGHHTFVASLLNFSSQSLVHVSHIDRFWQLEDIGIKDDAVTPDDDLAVAQFDKSVQKVNGRFTVAWPWKSGSIQLPDNRSLALSRLHHLHRRLSQKPDILSSYHEVIQDQMNRGIVEIAPQIPEKNAIVHYLAHHEVIRSDHTTTKLRIVYDGSAKKDRKSPSLNDCLLRGPILMSDLCGLLMRFRSHVVAFTADIEKAYLQVGLHLPDREVTRFFWLRDVKQSPTPHNLITLRFTRVLFGIISSAFLLAATIRHKMAESGTPAAQLVARDTYVDNFASGTQNANSAIAIFHEVSKLFDEISMNIRAWRSNCDALMNVIPTEKLAKQSDSKVLGLVWDHKSDTISVQSPKVTDVPVVTKRHLLQASAKMYDPCGFFAPVVIRAKLLVQELWVRKIGWDDPIPEGVKNVWKEISVDLDRVSSVSVPRYLGFDVATSELHVFCDASTKVFAAVVYLRATDQSIPAQLLMSKARLAPLKKVTIPRLELMAAVIGVRLLRFVKQQLSVDFSRTVLWSDSKCVLYWLASTKALSVFVENRVREINSSDAEKRYVPTEENPADLPTKGRDLNDLANCELWWKGPSFLALDESHWPATPALDSGLLEVLDTSTTKREDADEDCPRSGRTNEIVYSIAAQADAQPESFGPFVVDISRFSSLESLIATTGWVLRFIGNASSKLKRKLAVSNVRVTEASLTRGEKHSALLTWINHAQSCMADGERPEVFRNLSKQMDLFKDRNGIIRCGGHMRNAELSNDAKFPILLPKGSAFTKLVIMQCHCDAMHQGPSLTLATLRAKFWVPHGPSQVKSVISKCQWCRLWDGKAFKLPKIAPLPSFRCTRSAPFETVGIDYFGPLFVVSDGSRYKCWICLFTCSVTRAVHLEVVTDQSTQQFLLAFRRFVSFCGYPSLVISDNAKYFKLAKDILERCQTNTLCQWKFIPEFSPWMGGFYERLVGSVKNALKKVLGKSLADLLTLQTLVAEVTRVVNSRPLTISNDIRDEILTPAHLIGRESSLNNLFDFETNLKSHCSDNSSLKESLLQLHLERMTILEQFWNVWRSSYLTSLRAVHRDFKAKPGCIKAEPRVGQAVLVKSEKPRATWPLAVIQELQKSADGLTRSVKIRSYGGKILIRPISLLVPLETECQVNRSDLLLKGAVDGPFDRASVPRVSGRVGRSDHTLPRGQRRVGSVDGRTDHSPDLTVCGSDGQPDRPLSRSHGRHAMVDGDDPRRRSASRQMTGESARQRLPESEESSSDASVEF